MSSSEIQEGECNKESTEESLRLIDDLKFFLATAPANWQENQIIRRYFLNKEEGFVSCVYWNNLYFISGTDIVRCIAYKLFHLGRKITDRKKFEEGIFSDLRALKCGTHAILEKPRSDFVKFLHKHQCLRTQKKQKVFFWFSVPHDELFFDALERDLKKEASGEPGTTKAFAEPSLSFNFRDGNDEFPGVKEQLKSHLDTKGLKMVESFASELGEVTVENQSEDEDPTTIKVETGNEESAVGVKDADNMDEYVGDFPLDYLQQVESSVINPEYISFNSVVGAYNPLSGVSVPGSVLITPSVGDLTLSAVAAADGSTSAVDSYNMSNENYLAYGHHYMEPSLYMQSPVTPFFSGSNDLYLLDQATPIAPAMFHQQQQIQQQQIQQQYYALYLQSMQSGVDSELNSSVIAAKGTLKTPVNSAIMGMTPNTALFYTPSISNSFLLSPVTHSTKKRKTASTNEDESTDKEKKEADTNSSKKKKGISKRNSETPAKGNTPKKQKQKESSEDSDPPKLGEDADPSPQILSSAKAGGSFNYMSVPYALQSTYQNPGLMGFSPYYSTIPQSTMGPANGLSPFITFSPTVFSHTDGSSKLIGGLSAITREHPSIHSVLYENKENSKIKNTPLTAQTKKVPTVSSMKGKGTTKTAKKQTLMNPALRHLNVETLYDGPEDQEDDTKTSTDKPVVPEPENITTSDHKPEIKAD